MGNLVMDILLGIEFSTGQSFEWALNSILWKRGRNSGNLSAAGIFKGDLVQGGEDSSGG